MADTPPSSARKGFNIGNPGVKEYAIVGVAALALGLWYFHRQKSKTAAAQSQSAQGTPVVLAGAGGGGVPFGAFFAWLQNHQASPQVTIVNKQPDHDGGDNDQKKGRGGKTATAPNVLNMGEAQAFSVLSAAGWSGHVSGPVGSTVVSQTPGPGQKITQGQSTYWPVNQGKPTIDLGLN